MNITGSKVSSPGVTWNHTYGGELYEHISSAIETADGGLAFLGDAHGPSNPDFWLIKTDANGVVEWNKTYGGTEADYGYSLIQTADGGFVMAGITQSYGAGRNDAWLVKTDSSGQVEWNQTFGGVSDERANALIETTDGGFAIAGATASFGMAGYFDAWLIKTDMKGEVEWSYSYGRPLWDEAESLIQTHDGGYVFAGHSDDVNAIYPKNLWLVKTDAHGKMLWNRTYGGMFDDLAHSIILIPDGGYVLAGYTRKLGNNSSDFWLLKTDAQGQLVWNHTYGGSELDWAFAVIQTVDGGYALAGETDSFGTGLIDFWVVKTNSTGIMQWNLTFGTPDWDLARTILQTSDGGLVVVGSTYHDNRNALVIKLGGRIHTPSPPLTLAQILGIMFLLLLTLTPLIICIGLFKSRKQRFQG